MRIAISLRSNRLSIAESGLDPFLSSKEYIERGQIYFGFEVDEKLLPFAIEEFGDQCWVYGSDIPHGDRLYGAVDVFLKRDDISEESKRKLLVDNTARFYAI